FGRIRRRKVSAETIKSVLNNMIYKPKSVINNDVMQSLSGVKHDDSATSFQNDRLIRVDLESIDSSSTEYFNASMLSELPETGDLTSKTEVGGLYQDEIINLEKSNMNNSVSDENNPESNISMEQGSSLTIQETEVKKKKTFEPMNIRPAGIEVKLPKIIGKFVQPSNPRLLKVAVLGIPNAGKSTLLNALIGETISIVSEKAHTTRERILMVLTEGNTQIVNKLSIYTVLFSIFQSHKFPKKLSDIFRHSWDRHWP
ncbi:3342_t:CDS:2, partial [Acaulospora morrowiae]